MFGLKNQVQNKWPYCRRRCTYCNFNKYVDPNVDEERLRKNLEQEMETLVRLSGVRRVSSIFFGGGTPSLASADTIASIIKKLRSVADFPDEGEITLETNPSSMMRRQRLKEFQEAGINRISLGVQSLVADDLVVLGRDHTVDESLRCLSDARILFPERVSVDLMFGRPGQTVYSWLAELAEILKVCDNHLSVYQLTLERGTRLHKDVHSNKLRMPSADDVASMYKMTVQILADTGYERYEVSNFAKNDSYSLHNMSYWMGLNYIGVGPGAHGRFWVKGMREARIQTLEPDIWMREVEAFGHATRKIVKQSRLDRLEELIAVGLRTSWGIPAHGWKEMSGTQLEEFCSSDIIRTYLEEDLLKLDSRSLRATDKGLDVLDSMIPSLLEQLQLQLQIPGNKQVDFRPHENKN